MIYDIYNPTRTPRIIYDGIEGSQRQYKLGPGARINGVALGQGVVDTLRSRTNDLQVFVRGQSAKLEPDKPVPIPSQKPPIVVDGMYGIGDNLHQRAAIRELMKTHEVWLKTCHAAVWHDMVKQGLHLMLKPTSLRTQAKIIEREKGSFPKSSEPPAGAHGIKIWYRKDQIDLYGTIAHTLMHECGVSGTPDFSFPVKPDWTARARELIANWNPEQKPLMIYRPIVQRREWNGANRNPDPVAYEALYKAVKDKFYVVSIADLKPNEEWIVGPEQPADLKIHDGSLPFEVMAGLFKEAALVFCNAGMAPVLAQAVGTPSIVVYGGRESFKTTQAAGAHLAPTLGIDPDRPCDCHTERHNCNKKITLPPAIEKVTAFADLYAKPKPKILIFATTYVDSDDRKKLTDQWLTLTMAMNPDCDILIVDSDSPKKPIIDESKHGTFEVYAGHRSARMLHDFGNNVGHLSRKGRDGWGRAFCFGLQAAVDCGYDYVAHVEGDSLLRLPIRPFCKDLKAASIPVEGMKGSRIYSDWLETGLMIFSTEYLISSGFVTRYGWEHKGITPTPEVAIKSIIGNDLTMLPIKGIRGDKAQVTHKNVVSLDLDWITHCHNDVWVYDRFLEAALGKEVVPSATGRSDDPPIPNGATLPQLKLNLGCGTNLLQGWENHDADVDITKRLPYAENGVDFLFCEHCVEHVSYVDAVRFFQESFRVLRRGGTIRITVPSIEHIYKYSTPAYWKFTTKFQPEDSHRGAMANIMFHHGHQVCWTASLLEATLFYAGFTDLKQCQVGESDHPELRGIEGHGKVIGEEFNKIESLCFEGTKPQKRIAIVVGGAKDVWDEIERAKALCGDRADFFIANDMIEHFPGEARAVTLHPSKLRNWLQKRKGPPPKAVWAHRKFDGVTDHTEDWSGSVGLFSTKIALQKYGYDRILLCGVPMEGKGGHFVRGTDWASCEAFKKGWERHAAEIAPHVRSYSGWTAQKFGYPDAEFVE